MEVFQTHEIDARVVEAEDDDQRIAGGPLVPGRHRAEPSINACR